jgi:hypothetical protein
LWLALAPVLVALLPAFALVSLRSAPTVRAASNGVSIQWDATMIYTGLNNGNPEGPVGEHARVHGSGFTSFAGQQLTLGLVQGDTGSQTGLCDPSTAKVPVGSVTPDGSGSFDYKFDWPALASSGTWSICALKPDGTPTGNSENGTFTVLSDKPPAIAVSTSTAQAGGPITVTGTSWLPAQRNISVYVGQCAACDGPIYTSQIVGSDTSGHFSATLTIPPAVIVTDAVVSAATTNGVLALSPQDSPHLAITPLPPTATVEPSPTATSTTTPTTAPVQGGQADQSGQSTGGANVGLIIGLVVAIVLLLAAIVGLVVYLLVKRNQPPSGPGGPGRPGSGFGSGFDREVGSGFDRTGYRTPTGYGPPRSSPMAPVPANPNLWGDDWDDTRTSGYPGQRMGTQYPGDEPTNPGYPPLDDPYH